MKIAAFVPFYSGSHQKWIDGLAKHSSHSIRLYTLPGRFWKWRMHGAAITLADQYIESGYKADLILCTDMIDVSILLSLTRKAAGDVPCMIYMHENQLTYPWSPSDRDVELNRDNHYAFINYASALAADAVVFNSQFHLDSFTQSLPDFLKQFPDHQNTTTIDRIKRRSQVLPVGLDLKSFDPYLSDRSRGKVPVILWNHRWEYDKGPEAFFDLILKLHRDAYPFELIVCGERTEKAPEVFDDVLATLSQRVIHWGYAKDFETYASLLSRADIVPITSRQDFFGISAVEAMYCGGHPILPDRLAFPELLSDQKAEYLYSSEVEMYQKMASLLEEPSRISAVEGMERYDWSILSRSYDAAFEECRMRSMAPRD